MSSSVDPATLQDYCRRLGLQQDADLLSRAQDCARHLSASNLARQGGVSAGCQAVLALHLSVSEGQQVELKSAARFAGLPKAKYQNLLENVKKELGVERRLGVQEVAVKMGVAQVRKDACDILLKYRLGMESGMSASAKTHANFDRAKYVCAAVAGACLRGKVKLADKAKLAETGGVSKRQLETLAKEMLEMNATAKNKTSKASKDSSQEDSSSASESPNKKRKGQVNLMNGVEEKKLNVDEDDWVFDADEFAAWKSKILKQAGMSES